MIKIIFICLFFTTSAYADTKLSGVDSKKILTEDESGQLKDMLKGLVSVSAKPAKNDYINDYNRGTIDFTTELRKDGTPLNRNYSYHKVIIPDGTIIKECNFSQRKPDTSAISGKNLTFIDCNLVNIKKDISWALIGTNNTQILREIKSQVDNGNGTTTLIIAHNVKDSKDGLFKEIAQDEEIILNSELANKLLYFAP